MSKQPQKHPGPHSDPPTTRRIEVFRPGTFTPMTGAAIHFSAADLADIAAVYDPAAAPAPVVVGHPATDAPAFAWAASFAFDTDAQRLTADIGDINPAFAAAVEAGSYKRVSLSLFGPEAPANPKPGHWYPRHIGFLGGAAPAVPGLKPVSFATDSADGTVTFEFGASARGEFGEPALGDVAALFRAMRDFFIDKFGIETADKTLPSWQIGWIADAAIRPDPGPQPSGASYADLSQEPKTMTDKAALDARQAELDAREKRLRDAERAAVHQGNVAFAASLVSAGRLIPGASERLVGVLDALSLLPADAAPVSFADGAADGNKATLPALDVLKGLLNEAPALVDLTRLKVGEGAVPARPADFAAGEGRTVDPASLDLHRRALAFQAAHPGIDYAGAVAAVS